MARREGPVSDDPGKEAVFSLVSKPGAFDLLSYQRASQVQKWEAPFDVSEDFKAHFRVWNLEPQRVAATNEVKMVWVKSSDKAADHLFVCASYIAVLCEYAGITVPPEPKQEQSSTIAA
jgi:hypothetical protein